MHLVVTIVLAALAAGAVVLAISSVRVRPAPGDAIATERWIVAHAPRGLRPALRAVDERVLGGAVVAVASAIGILTAVAVAWVLDSIDDERGVAQWDRSAAEWSSRSVSDGASRILEVVTELGGTPVLLVIAVVIGLQDLIRRRHLAVPAYLAVVAVGVVIVNNAVKLWIDRERPDIDQLVGWSGASFPSGHAAAAAACWAAFLLVLTRHGRRPTRVIGGITAVIVAATVAATRVLLGVHWLTDVVAGVIVGWGWFLVVSVAFGDRLAPCARGRDEATERASDRALETT